MDKNIISGNGKQITGTIKETVGKLSGNTELELEGKAEIAFGKGEVALGALTDKKPKAPLKMWPRRPNTPPTYLKPKASELRPEASLVRS